MNTRYYPTVCYSQLPLASIRKTLDLSEKVAMRPMVRYNNNRKCLEQTRMTLIMLSPEDKKALSAYFKQDSSKHAEGGPDNIELGTYHIRENRMPKENQEPHLYLRFDKGKHFSHTQIESILRTWLVELEESGVIEPDSYTLQIPLQDREDTGRHSGYAFLRFTDQPIEDICVVFAMLQNRRLKKNHPKNYLSVSWMTKRERVEKA